MAHKVTAIASDLDGTLLQNGAQSLDAEIFELIEALRQRGIYFFAASGRQYANLRRLFAPVADEIGYVCENGCVSYLEGKLVTAEHMADDLGKEIIADIQAHENLEVMVSGIHTAYLQPKDPGFADYMKSVIRYNITVVDDLLQPREEYMKISFYNPEGLGDVSYWRERYGARCTVQRGGSCWLDFMPEGVNKWTALQKNLHKLALSPTDCMVFGDNENDRQMLMGAGCPVTMATARDSIRPLGRFVTDRVEPVIKRVLCGEGYEW